MYLPNDDYVLLSLVNTKLRDCYSSFAELCEEEDVDGAEILARLSAIGYSYEEKLNAFR